MSLVLFYVECGRQGEPSARGVTPIEIPRRALSFDTKCQKSYSVTFDKSNKT